MAFKSYVDTKRAEAMKKNVTRNDVAKLAGVSPAVVSYVINQSKNVSAEKCAQSKKR